MWIFTSTPSFLDDHLTYRAFRAESVDYIGTASAKLSRGGRGGPHLIIKTSSRTISISVDSLGEATQLLQSKLGDLH